MIRTGTDTKPNHLAQSGKNGKLNKAHYHTVRSIKLLIGIIHRITQKEREEADKHAKEKKEIVFFHFYKLYFSMATNIDKRNEIQRIISQKCRYIP